MSRMNNSPKTIKSSYFCILVIICFVFSPMSVAAQQSPILRSDVLSGKVSALGNFAKITPLYDSLSTKSMESILGEISDTQLQESAGEGTGLYSPSELDLAAAKAGTGLEGCSQLYLSMDNLTSITSKGGVVTGTLAFPAGINNNAAYFNKASKIRFNSTIFNSDAGTISFWVKKDNSDTKGGIVQIGNIGSASSLGVFYNFNTSIYYEFRGETGGLSTMNASNAINNNFNHIVVTWQPKDVGYSVKLFVNGRYVNGNYVAATFVDKGYMDIGWVGYYVYGNVTIDELRFFNYQLSDPEIYAEYVLSSNKHRKQATNKPVSTGPVKIINNELYVNNKPFKVKGVGYQPIPIGEGDSATSYIYSNAAILQRDMKYLRAMGVNTIRLWSQISNTTLLDALYNNGTKPIYAIMSLEVSPSGDYSSNATIASYESQMTSFVNTFKNHPAVLAWAIGNENNLHYTGNKTDWYVLGNRLAKAAYEAEGASYHPTMLINGYMLYMGDVNYKSDDISMNYTDMWGHNSYTGYSFNCYFDYYNKLSAKPLILTEFGTDAYNTSSGSEYQDVQAAWLKNQYNEVKQGSAGGTVMAYSDEWWKSSGGLYSIHDTGGYGTDVQPDGFSNEEWWGVMAVQDNGTSPDIMLPRKAYYALQGEFLKDQFVMANGTGFALDGKPFYFSGTNAYYLWYGNINCSSPSPNQGCVIPLLDDALSINLSVIRTWGFSNGIYKYGYSFQPSPGVYDENTFAHFDRVIKEASDRNLKLVITLVNNWDDFGGMNKYNSWCNLSNHDDFYTNACTKNLYKNYVAYFLNRTNTITGIKYKNDPTIMAWELANEPRCRSDTSGVTLNNWIGEMSAYIKSIDPNHLVTTGVDGGYKDKGSDPFAWWYKGNEGQDYYANHAWSSVDFATFHYYYDMDPTINATKWIQEHIEDAHNITIIGKPVLFEEFNTKTNRAATLLDWYNKMEGYGVDGDTFWMLADNYISGSNDGYFVFCPEDTEVCSIIATHANHMNGKNNACSNDSECAYLDNDYCNGTLIKHDEGRCISSECTVETTTVQDCSNGLYCDGQETCNSAACAAGTAINCSGNDLPQIATCDNDPDNNPFTWDSSDAFASQCNETSDSCTTGTYTFTHTCDIFDCDAECELDGDCPATDCDQLDGCVENDYHDYADVDNDCLGDCNCENNACGAPTIIPNDPICVVECYNDSECGTDGWIGSDYCSGDDVWNTWRAYTCSNPGTTNSSCSYADNAQIKESCADTCEAGACVGIVCYNYSDCPADSYGADYCSGNNVYRNLTSYTCVNPGTPSSECQPSTAPELVEACDDSLYCNGQESCSAGSCAAGTAIDCSGNDLPQIATCTNNPDNNPFTWDSSDAFASQCNENNDSCTTGTYTFTHTCDIFDCDAECVINGDCDDSNPLTIDSCSDCSCLHETPEEAGRIFYESFDNESSIISNNGTGYGTPVFVDGIKGNSINGTSQFYVSYPLYGNFPSDNGTIEFWYKRAVEWPTDTDSKGFFDIGRLYGLNPNSMGMFGQTGITTEIRNNATSMTQISASNRGPYRWHYATFAWNRTSGDCFTGSTYHDGALGSSKTFCSFFPNLSGDMWVGKNYYYGASDSYMDEFKIFDYAKNSTSINNEYYGILEQNLPQMISYGPQENYVFVDVGDPQAYSVEVSSPKSRELTIEWFIEDVLVKTETGTTSTLTHSIGHQGTDKIYALISDGEGFFVSHRWYHVGVDSSSDCVIPYGGMVIDGGTVTLCPGRYYMNGTIWVDVDDTLECNNTVLSGNRTLTAINTGSRGTVRGCEFENFGYVYYGMHRYGNAFENNVIRNCSTAFHLHDEDFSEFRNNTITGTSMGFRIWWGSYYNEFVGNTIENTSTGFYFDWYSGNNLFEGNHLTNNTYGFYHYQSYYGTIQNLTIISNELKGNNYAVYLGATQNSTIRNNNITGNTYGIRLTSSANNTIYLNNFINNTNSWYEPGTNIWDYGLQGNYWSNHDEASEGCFDADANGICDSPYALNANNSDNSPFTTESGWSSVVCYADLDCGTGGWIGSDYCSGDDVWNTWRAYTCSNPGTTNSSCSYADNAQIKESCADTCEAGACVGIVCYNDSECPADSYGADYCSGSNVYRNLTSYTCINPGTPSSECQPSTAPELVEACDDSLYCNGQESCSAGSCAAGTAIDCSGNDLPQIATCTNNPDNNPFTWDYAAAFISRCNEPTDSCTTGTQALTHTCDIGNCSAECEVNADCDDSNPLTEDSCLSDCTCHYEDIGPDLRPRFEIASQVDVNQVANTSLNVTNNGSQSTDANIVLYDMYNYKSEDFSGGVTERVVIDGTAYNITAYWEDDKHVKFVVDGEEIILFLYEVGKAKDIYISPYYYYGPVPNYCVAYIGKAEVSSVDALGIAAGETREVELNWVPTRLGYHSLHIFANATDDSNWYDNYAQDSTQVIEMACYNDSDCPADSYGAGYCSGNNVYRNLTSYTCVNPGTPSSGCQPSTAPELVRMCNDSLYCNGQESCSAGSCAAGTAIDCSGNNLPGIATCTNNPDNNPFTWDYAAAFISRCNEPTDSCTTGTQALTHTCDIGNCSAECEVNADCNDGNQSTTDSCLQNCSCQHRVDYLCTDSDGGKDYYVKGQVQDSYDTRPFSDYCTLGGREVSSCTDKAQNCGLIEKYCGINNRRSGYYLYSGFWSTCPNGCSNGACIV